MSVRLPAASSWFGVDRRGKQRQAAHHAAHVHAVANLEQAVLDSVPIGDEIGIFRHAEIGVDVVVGQGVDAGVDGDRLNGGQDLLEVDQELRDVRRRRIHVQDVLEGHRRLLVAIAAALRPRAEQVGGEEIEQRSLVDRFPRVLRETLVAPVDQIVDVAHHDRLLIGAGAKVGDREGIEGVVVPVLDGLVVGEDVGQAFRGLTPERQELPVAVLRRRGVLLRGRVEEILVPGLGGGELLVAVELDRVEERHLQIEFAPVEAVG